MLSLVWAKTSLPINLCLPNVCFDIFSPGYGTLPRMRSGPSWGKPAASLETAWSLHPMLVPVHLGDWWLAMAGLDGWKQTETLSALLPWGVWYHAPLDFTQMQVSVFRAPIRSHFQQPTQRLAYYGMVVVGAITAAGYVPLRLTICHSPAPNLLRLSKMPTLPLLVLEACSRKSFATRAMRSPV